MEDLVQNGGFENLTVAEFICRHKGAEYPVDVNGLPLPLEASIRVRYQYGGDVDWPVEYAAIDETGPMSWAEGEFRSVAWHDQENKD